MSPDDDPMAPVDAIPIASGVTVNTRQVNVSIDGIDLATIPSSFRVRLLNNGQVVASSFWYQTYHPSLESGPIPEGRLAYFDFLLPIEALADGELRLVIEPVAGGGFGDPILPEHAGNPTLSIHLMLAPTHSERKSDAQ